jgi:ketosteroid isomerase-like protein
MNTTISETTHELMRLGRDWDKAIEANDVNEMSRYMDDSWVIVGSDGINSKENFLDLVRSGDLQHSKMDFEDLRVEIYDNTAVVTSKGTSAGTYKRMPFSFHEWTTSVFLKRNGNWVCVLTMIAPAKDE